MNKKINSRDNNCRVQAAQIIAKIIQQQGSLDDLLKTSFERVDLKDRGFLQEICYGTLRYYYSLNHTIQSCLNKPIRNKDIDVLALLLVGAYQLFYMRIPEYAAINETVNACIALNKPWAKGLINGVLRNLKREHSDGLNSSDDEQIQFNHPQWLIQQIRQDWPAQADSILTANNQKAPMTLRVNVNKTSRSDYLSLLQQNNILAHVTQYSSCGIQLETSCDVTSLPGFSQGLVSVQDEAAQLCANLLHVDNQHKVIDACAAPGGKACHILETAPDVQLLAIEKESQRLGLIEENLQRLQLKAQCLCADASQPDRWPIDAPESSFDRILIDAPCSATGVIRRHPDIKLLRRKSDIAKLSNLQCALLINLWPLLKKGGLLLYSTCSILKCENDEVLASFLAKADDACLEPIAAEWGVASDFGRQLLPQSNAHDGFFYALLRKI